MRVRHARRSELPGRRRACPGATLAERGITVVYGGGKLGLMGAVADSALEAGGKVIGVIPEALGNAEVAHRGLTELHVVARTCMRERRCSPRFPTAS